MSRFSPTVAPENAPDQFRLLTGGVADAIDRIRARKRQKEEDQVTEEERQRRHGREDTADAAARDQASRQKLLDAIALHSQGYREGAPPTADQGAAPGDGVAAGLLAQRGNQLQGGPAYQAPPAAAPDQRGNFTPAMAYDRQREPMPASESLPEGVDDVAGGLLAQRGMRTQAGPGQLGPQPSAVANRTQSSPDVAAMLERQRASVHPRSQVPAPGSVLPVDPQQGGSAAPPASDAMAELGRKYYQIPGQQGYIDLGATPEARTQAATIATEGRQHAAKLDELGVEAGYKGTEAAAGDTRQLARERELEHMREGSAERIEGMKGRRESATDRRMQRTTENEETEGLALLNSILVQPGRKPSNPKLAAAFSPLFRAARAADPNMPPGQLSLRILSGLKEARPDLFAAWQNVPELPADTTRAPQRRPLLMDEEKARARSDAGFKEFLVGKGYRESDF